ncbi:MAG TPA: hypothetical protein VLT32_09060 [Candidatus Sulfomarinibacteraceae bacterium]|nr:hypothetical protein [Candidatus Sulfomarinibacteraceae bacterium]
MEQPVALIGLAAALLVAVIGLAVALRFLYRAWVDVYLQRNRRTGGDRRREDLPVPMERRRRPDRRL